MKRALIAGMLLSAVSAVAVTATASAGEGITETVYAPKDCTKPRVEPKQITIACADDGIYLNRLSWEQWGGDKARGAGILRVNTCNPNCAEGPIKSYDANVRLVNPKRTQCGGRSVLMYNRVHLRFPNKKPRGAKDLRSEELFCNS
jgi:hypothetical protein